jgi:hypothetical protein
MDSINPTNSMDSINPTNPTNSMNPINPLTWSYDGQRICKEGIGALFSVGGDVSERG